MRFSSSSSSLSGSTSAQSALWTRLSESTPPCRPAAMAVDAARNVYVAGSVAGRSKAGRPHAEGVCLIKYDASGQQLWTRSYDATKAAFPSGMAVDPSNSVYVEGSFYRTHPHRAAYGQAVHALASPSSSARIVGSGQRAVRQRGGSMPGSKTKQSPTRLTASCQGTRNDRGAAPSGSTTKAI